MANAGCINAIGCDGCFIETLQELDSSNIGVGVQFTAPDPLDDRRLDYIKYTDKCGNICCLTNENEILIYATQGEIKTFTLTNDSNNKVVNVKRSEIFGNNRAKTIVRYKIGGYPTDISDGTLAVQETTMNQYSSTGYNVSGLSNGTTYYFSAFALDGNDNIIDTKTGSVETDFGRQPGVNTIAYFPMDTDLLDHSGKSFSITKHGNVSIQTIGGISAGYFGNLGDLRGDYTYNNTSLTVLGYIYKTGNPNYDNASIFGYGINNLGGPQPGLMYYNTNGPSWASNKPGVVVQDSDTSMSGKATCVSMNNNQWCHFAFTYDVSTGLITLYVNGSYNQSYTATMSRVPNVLGMSRRQDMDRSWKGYMSNVIFEDKLWTSTEISNYVDSTKGIYGIS